MLSDKFGNEWPKSFEVCPTCGQPDNCGDCNHNPLTPQEVVDLGGYPRSATDEEIERSFDAYR